MLRADGRLVVSHVGSMVRPPAMIPYLQKAQAGEPYDKAAFEACLTDSVIEAVRLQADAGIDAVSDGEYGKSGGPVRYVTETGLRSCVSSVVVTIMAAKQRSLRVEHLWRAFQHCPSLN